MQIELCDICGQPLMTYTENGHEYKPIRMAQRTAQKLILWRWEPMSICGECRAMLARKRKEQIVEKAFEELPLNADVVEVVRCKDCKHHEELLNNNDGNVLCWVHDIDVVVDRNGYCNYGERKEQE